MGQNTKFETDPYLKVYCILTKVVQWGEWNSSVFQLPIRMESNA